MATLKEALALQKKMEEANDFLTRCKADLAAIEKRLSKEFGLTYIEAQSEVTTLRKELAEKEEVLNSKYEELKELFETNE